MLTFAFDTSFKTAAVSLLQDETILYDVVINSGLNHSETLLPAVEHACSQLKVKIDDIDLLACTLGPGSFTGLRVGISTLKGLLLACGKPAVGVSALAALALNVTDNSALIYSLMDAGRGQVYAACYRYDNQDLLIQVSGESVVDPGKIVFDPAEDIILVGGGALKYRDILTGKAKNVKMASGMQQYIRGFAVGVLGREKYFRNELLDPDTVVPVYLRAADAKLGKPLFHNGDNIVTS
jgi:tRNA threonylcarbamoyladenosine biosynthesis protein TsaB